MQTHGETVPTLARLLAHPQFRDVVRWLEHAEAPDFERLARFGDSPYTRRVLHLDEHLEVAIIGWEPGQRSPIHDHGHSVGAMRVLSGELVERRYTGASDGVRCVGKRRRRPGAVVRELSGTIHEVVNASNARAVTLHAYLPCIEVSNVYRRAKTPSRLGWVAAAAAMLGIGLAVRRELRFA